MVHGKLTRWPDVEIRLIELVKVIWKLAMGLHDSMLQLRWGIGWKVAKSITDRLLKASEYCVCKGECCPFCCWHLGGCWMKRFEPLSHEGYGRPICMAELILPNILVFGNKTIKSWSKVQGPPYEEVRIRKTGRNLSAKSIWWVEDHLVLTSRMSITAEMVLSGSVLMVDLISFTQRTRRWGLEWMECMIFRCWIKTN